MKIRRKVVERVVKYHSKKYKGTGLLKYKRKNNIKYSAMLDRCEHVNDERMGVIEMNDLLGFENLNISDLWIVFVLKSFQFIYNGSFILIWNKIACVQGSAILNVSVILLGQWILHILCFSFVY